jgi:hypothetical protein
VSGSQEPRAPDRLLQTADRATDRDAQGAGRVKGLPMDATLEDRSSHLEVTPVVSGGMILFFGIAALA